MPHGGDGVGCIYLAVETLGFGVGDGWEACIPAQIGICRRPVSFGPAIGNHKPDSHQACGPMSAMVWALRWAEGWSENIY